MHVIDARPESRQLLLCCPATLKDPVKQALQDHLSLFFVCASLGHSPAEKYYLLYNWHCLRSLVCISEQNNEPFPSPKEHISCWVVYIKEISNQVNKYIIEQSRFEKPLR